MKALTIQQPWAWAIMHGGKNIENRVTAWTYRGPLAIHAGMSFSYIGADDARLYAAWQEAGTPLARDVNDASAYLFGAFLGVVDLVDVHWENGCCQPWGDDQLFPSAGRPNRDVAHLVLENPRPVDVPIPARGKQGLWTPDGYDAAELTRRAGL